MKSNRIMWVDTAKGIGMLAVIWGHIMTTGWSYVVAYAFDIPLFLFLSGMMFNNEKYNSIVKLVSNRVRTLLIPYFVFSVVTWIIWCAYNLVFHKDVDYIGPLLQTFIAFGSGGYLVHNVALWFVTCLFLIEVIYFYIAKLSVGCNLFVCMLLAALGHFMLNNNFAFDFTKLPWNMEAAASGMLWYCAGNLFRNKRLIDKLKELMRKNLLMSKLAWLIFSALFICGALYNGHVTLGSNRLGKSTILYYCIGFIGIGCSIILCLYIEGYWKGKLARRLVDKISWVGTHSFYFMAVHVPIKGFLAVILAKLLKTSATEISSNMALSGIVFVATIICASVVVYIIDMSIKKKNGRNV